MIESSSLDIQPLDLDPKDIREIEIKYNIIDDFNLAENLQRAWRMYFVIKNIPSRKEIKDYSKSLIDQSDELIESIDSYSNAINDKKLKTMALMSPVAPALYRAQYNDSYFNECRKMILRTKCLAESVVNSLGSLKKGDKDPAYNSVLNLLIVIFIESTNPVTISVNYNPRKVGEEYYGDLFEFVRDCLKLLKLNNKSNSALGSAIKSKESYKSFVGRKI